MESVSAGNATPFSALAAVSQAPTASLVAVVVSRVRESPCRILRAP